MKIKIHPNLKKMIPLNLKTNCTAMFSCAVGGDHAKGGIVRFPNLLCWIRFSLLATLVRFPNPPYCASWGTWPGFK